MKITYRGWAGHFICADRCLFRLNTLIEHEDVKVVVSTVGLMRDGKEICEIGHNRYFETMAFHAYLNMGKFWDNDVTREIDFESRWAYSSPEDELAAQEGHQLVVEEIAAKILSGEITNKKEEQ